MRQYFIEVESCEEAAEAAPWACVIIKVEGGYLAFESAADAAQWEGADMSDRVSAILAGIVLLGALLALSF